MKLGKGSIKFGPLAINAKQFGALVVDTCVASKIAKSEGVARQVYEHLLEQKWCLFLPAPAMFELGLGRRSVDQSKEAALWSEVFRLKKAIPAFSLITTSIAMSFQTGDVVQYQGDTTLAVPSEMDWLAVKYASQNRLERDPRANMRSIQKNLMDEFIYIISRNLLAAIWSDDPQDMISTQILNHPDYIRRNELLPVFTTDDLQQAFLGEHIHFPTEALKKRVKSEVVKRELQRLGAKRPSHDCYRVPI